MNFDIRPEIENMGGVNFFLFQEIDNILSIPRQINAIIAEILLKNDNDWFYGYGTPGSLELTVTPSAGDQGTVYDVVLSGEYPSPSATMQYSLNDMINRKFLVLAKDQTDRVRVLGSYTESMTFSFTEKTGKQASDRAGIQFSFSGRFLTPPWFYGIDIGSQNAPVLH